MEEYITVKLFATLSKFTPRESEKHPISPGTTVKELIHSLNVPEKEVKLIFVNSRKGELSSVLKDGDRVGIFPPVGGG